MLTTLLESRAIRTRGLSAHALSIGVHTALIAAAIVATERIGTIFEAPVFEPPPLYVRPAAPPAPPTSAPALPTFRGFTVLAVITHVPFDLPQIDLRAALTDPNAFTGVGLPGGRPDGVVTTAVPVGDLTVDQVDRPAHLLPGSGRPSYPEALRSAGLAGEVQAQFVIDSTGRADMRSLTFLSSTHPRFSDAVTNALAKARFAPAEFGGRKVRQIVRMPFVFSIER